jgi:hypothetical protein
MTDSTVSNNEAGSDPESEFEEDGKGVRNQIYIGSRHLFFARSGLRWVTEPNDTLTLKALHHRTTMDCLTPSA